MFNVLKQQKGVRKGLYSVLVASVLATSLTATLVNAADEPGTGVSTQAVDPYTVSNLMLNPGADESQVNLTWYSAATQPVGTVVQIAKKADVVDGVFPVATAASFNGTSSAAVAGFFSNKATITGLQESTDYVYRVGDGLDEHWSTAYNFSTKDSHDFSVMFVGDPQIGAGGNAVTDGAGWANTLTKATQMFPDMSYIMSAGDQVNTASSETEYTNFLNPSQLRNLPVATVVGNHDGAVNYKYHYNQPNESSQYGITVAGGDYYYTYGETLFMVLNSNSANSAEHETFMKNAIDANPNARWKIVTFHHSIYSAASHATDTQILNLRQALFPVFDKLKIDLVFMGHDHSYVKTYQMEGDQAIKGQAMDNGVFVNPKGIMYLTANSASGSKYYDLKTTFTDYYSDVKSQLKVPTFSMINIDHNTISVDTYRTDTMAKVDTYTMVHTDMTGLDVTAPTKKNYALGELLDTKGMTVSKINLDGSKTPLPLDQVAITGFDSATKGTKHVTVTYTVAGIPYSGTFDVQVGTLVKIYAKKDTIIKEESAGAEFYLALGKAEKVNTLDVTFKYDASKFTFDSATGAELLDKTNGFLQANEAEPGTVRIIAGFQEHPLTLTELTDLMKLTFKPVNPDVDNVQADVQVVDAVVNSSNENTDFNGVFDTLPASIIIRSYKDITDLFKDGKLTSADLSVAIDHYRASQADADWATSKLADVNFDGKVDLTDFTIIILHIFQGK
ncbi:metallophosphoesterase [Paenibacillus sp. MMO-177]|uniref:metallophosphoesterase n=1 Tax=Paenibacillus sp. MMO-177 TaxID=3081289 RepID=UPI0030176FEC